MQHNTVEIPNWLNILIVCFSTFFSGALLVGIPLLWKLSKLRTEIRQDDLNLKRQQHNQQVQVSIDSKWEELLKARVDELARLQLRDEEQEKKIDILYEKHLECQKKEAVLEERAKIRDERISALEAKLQERDRQYTALEERLKFFESKM